MASSAAAIDCGNAVSDSSDFGSHLAHPFVIPSAKMMPNKKQSTHYGCGRQSHAPSLQSIIFWDIRESFGSSNRHACSSITLAAAFEPAQYRDHYRQNLNAVI